MNNRKPLVIIALAVLLCGLLAFRGATAEDRGQAEYRENSEREDAAKNGRPIEFHFQDGIWEGRDYSLIAHLFNGLYREPEWTEYNGILYGTLPVMDLDRDGSPDITFVSGNMEAGYDAFIVHLAGSSIKGTYTWHKKFEESEYYYEAYTPEATVVFYFGEEQPKESYSISVEGGYATDWKGNRITQAAPGEEFRAHFDVTEGKYVPSETRTTSSGYVLKNSLMPCADITIVPNYEEQVPYTIDMTSGFGCVDAWTDGRYIEYVEKLASQDGLLDLDGDGTFDLRRYNEYSSTDDLVALLFIPLSTGSIRGEYSFQNPGEDYLDKYNPITLRFPENGVDEEYFISVSGGEALDEQGNVINRAAPGTLFYLHKIPEQNFHYSTNLENWPSGWTWGDKCLMCMPACDIEFSLKVSGEDDTPSVTPTPTAVPPTPTEEAVTPVPTEEAVSPTPTEADVTPVPTEDQKGTDTITDILIVTIEPTPAEADSSKTADGDEKKGGFNPLYVMIPITVLVLGAAVFTFSRESRKKR
ncbi:MAG: hypothetical protein J5648_01670 [Lachnospiraceae bacterium]|nr:hypothetical protein [Lachnospiraceae bacterium]